MRRKIVAILGEDPLALSRSTGALLHYNVMVNSADKCNEITALRLGTRNLRNIAGCVL